MNDAVETWLQGGEPAEAAASAPPNVILLNPPIEFQNGKYEQLLLREPTTGEVLMGDQQLNNGVTQAALKTRQIYILAKVANVPQPVIQKLPISQFNAAWDYVQGFLEAGLATGRP